MSKATIEKISNLCKRHGFIFQSSELYNGINGFWDYGPNGVAMRRALEQAWWNYMVETRDNVEGQERADIAQVHIAVNRRSTDVHAHKGRMDRLERLFGSCQAVADVQGVHGRRFVFTCKEKTKQRILSVRLSHLLNHRQVEKCLPECGPPTPGHHVLGANPNPSGLPCRPSCWATTLQCLAGHLGRSACQNQARSVEWLWPIRLG